MTFKSAKQAVLLRIARHHAAAVDQHQRALRAEVAKIDFGGTRCAVRNARGLSGTDRRQLVQNVFDAGRTGELHVLVGNDRDGGCGLKVRLRNARAGNDDVLAGLNVLTLAETVGVGAASTGPVGSDAMAPCPARHRRSQCRTHRPARSMRAGFDESRLHIGPLIRPHGGRTWRSHCPITVTEQG